MVRALITMTFVGCAGDGTTDPDPTTPVPDPYVTDTFPQTLITPVDVLWVVDPGWDEGLQALDDVVIDDAFHLYLLADPSWRLGVLDPTASGGAFGLIKSVLETWPRINPLDVLPPEARLEPRYRETVYTALTLRVAEGDNDDFLRSDAHLYIVYMGSRPDATEDTTLTLDGYEAWLAELRPSDSKRITILTDGFAAPYWEDHTFGGGKVFDTTTSYRDALFSVFLDSMGQRTTFTLTQKAAEAPTVATVIYRDQRTDYAIDRDFSFDPVSNSITFFDEIPPPQSTIEVRYIPASPAATTTDSAATTTDPGTTTATP